MTATEAPPSRYVTEIPLDDIHPVDHNRHLGDPEGLEGMAATMRVVGVLEPLLVRSTDGNGYELIAGARRHAAARLAGLATVPCLIENHRSDEDVELARIIENLQRLDPTEIEEAQAYERLTQPPFNMTGEAIAASVGRVPSHISKRRSLLALPDPVKEALTDKRIHITTALEITKLARDGAALDKIVDALPAPDASNETLERARQALERQLDAELRDQALARKVAEKTAELEAAGHTIVDYPPNGQWSSTEYRVIRPPEEWEAVAVTATHAGDVQVVYVTTQPLTDAQRHTAPPAHKPPKPEGDIGFVEQARRKKEAERLAAAEPRRKTARLILSEDGHDLALRDYVQNHALASVLAGSDLNMYDSRVALELLDVIDVKQLDSGLERDEELRTWASSCSLSRLRVLAALFMSWAENELTRYDLAPGALVALDDPIEDDDRRAQRQYLELLQYRGYDLNATEQAALTPEPADA